MTDPMELAWTLDPEPYVELTRESNIRGRTWFLGPFVFGSFRYLDDEGGGFWFVHVRGTRLGISREW